jgi:hypothetical protein
VNTDKWWSKPFENGKGFVVWDTVKNQLSGELRVEVVELPRGVQDLFNALKGSKSLCLDSENGHEVVFRAYQELIGKLQ